MLAVQKTGKQHSAGRCHMFLYQRKLLSCKLYWDASGWGGWFILYF